MLGPFRVDARPPVADTGRILRFVRDVLEPHAVADGAAVFVAGTRDDRDAMIAALSERGYHEERRSKSWELYEIVRCDEDYVDFPATLARFRAEFPHESCSDEVAQLIEDFPYRDYVYPGAFDAIAEVWRVATPVILSDGDSVFQPRKIARAGLEDAVPPVILSDGDSVFQPRKIARAGLEDAVRGNVLVFVHKEQHLDELARRFPGSRPAFVDDKAPILGRIKRRLGDAATTIHVHQGKYAAARVDRGDPAPDVEIDAIAGLGAVVARL